MARSPMWKYQELDAHHTISLHDCKVNRIELYDDDLIFHFYDGFWITPTSAYIDHDRPLKTGPSCLRFYGFRGWSPVDMMDIDVFKTTHLFRKPLLCRRLQPEAQAFLDMINSGRYELEFLYEFHSGLGSLYKCWLWKTNRGMDSECHLEINAAHIEYCWNEIRADCEW